MKVELMPSISDLPAINASLNFVSTVFISAGWYLIRHGAWRRPEQADVPIDAGPRKHYRPLGWRHRPRRRSRSPAPRRPRRPCSRTPYRRRRSADRPRIRVEKAHQPILDVDISSEHLMGLPDHPLRPRDPGIQLGHLTVDSCSLLSPFWIQVLA